MCDTNCHYCMCRNVTGGVILSVTIVCAGQFLGVSCQVSVLYVQGCSLECYVECPYPMCRGISRGVMSIVTIVWAGVFLGVSCQVSLLAIGNGQTF